MTKRIGVAAVFLVGCAVGGVSGQLVVPKASAQQATLAKYEYRCAVVSWLSADDFAHTQALVSSYAEQNWELVPAASHGSAALFCFKRPKL